MTGNVINYETLKQMAKQHGTRVPDLLALAPKNDPFYIGAPATVAAARWFTAVWNEAGYTTGVHLRRVHYWLVSNPVNMPSGERYENTDACWKWLGDAGKYARYLGYISPDAFIDRRNPQAIIYDLPPNDEPNPAAFLSAWELPDLALPDPPKLIAGGYEGVEQEYSLEIWAEKTTMNDILEPLCRRYGMNLVTGAGELNITAVRDFLRRVRKPTRILYVSDFDPAGLGMPVSVARKIEFYQRTTGTRTGYDIALQPVVLTAAQVETYQLPRIPVKDTDARKGNFEAAHGAGQVELDALEALHPGQLADILQDEILQYLDPELRQAVSEAEDSYQEGLDTATETIHKKHAAELNALEREFSELMPRYQDLKDRAAQLFEQIEGELSQAAQSIEPEPLPEPSALGDRGNLLYSSERGYFDQLQIYKAHRNGDTQEDE